MTLVLHDHPASSNALKVRFLLAVLGLDYARSPVSLARPRAADYVALNPVGGIPTLVDGAFVLSESHAILKYLCAREGRDDLYPSEPHERARVDELLDRWQARLRPVFARVELPALGYVRATGTFEPSAVDLAAAREGEAAIAPDLELFASLVGDGHAVLGRFTIADVALAPTLFRSTKTGMDLTPYPRLAALRDAILAHPAWPAADPVT